MSAPLSPSQSRILDAFAAVHFSVPDLLASLKLSATDFLAWAAAPAVASALDTLRAALAAAHDLRHLSLRELTLSALASVLNDSNSPAEIRRAATTLLATLDRPAPPASRAASPTASSPSTQPPLSPPRPAPPPPTPSSRPTHHPAPNPPSSTAAAPAPPTPNATPQAVRAPGVPAPTGGDLRRELLPPAPPALIPRSPSRAAALLARAGAPSRPP